MKVAKTITQDNSKSKKIKSALKSSKNRTFSEDDILLESAKIASTNAVRVSTALALPIKVIKDHKIVLINPDKSEKVIKELQKSTVDVSNLRKGSVLERK